MKTDKILDIIWRLDCCRSSIETSRSITKYQLYDKLSDFVERQKDHHRHLINGYGNYYSCLDAAPTFRWSDNVLTYMFSLLNNPSLRFTLYENNYDIVELFIHDAVRFGIDLTHFMSTHFDVPYDLLAGIKFENAGLLWWKLADQHNFKKKDTQ